MVRGFSLIELMVVIAVVALLSAIAVPSYKNYMLRAEIISSYDFMMKNMVDAEKVYYGQHGRFGTLEELGFQTSTNINVGLTGIENSGMPYAGANCTTVGVTGITCPFLYNIANNWLIFDVVLTELSSPSAEVELTVIMKALNDGTIRTFTGYGVYTDSTWTITDPELYISGACNLNAETTADFYYWDNPDPSRGCSLNYQGTEYPFNDLYNIGAFPLENLADGHL